MLSILLRMLSLARWAMSFKMTQLCSRPCVMATKNKFSPSPRHPRKTRVPVHGLRPCISHILAKYGEVGAASAVLGREVAQVVAIRRAEDLGLAEGCLPSSLEPPQTLSLRFAALLPLAILGFGRLRCSWS